MAPTEVLAEQHYLGLEPLARLVGVRMALLTAVSPDRDEVLAAVAAGTMDVVVGTHALIQEGVHFARLGIAVVDEQHRFGVYQRVALREKAEGPQPDLLIMTATPIPRTLSMTLYGDLDVSVLDEMPAHRPAVRTAAVGKARPGTWPRCTPGCGSRSPPAARPSWSARWWRTAPSSRPPRPPPSSSGSRGSSPTCASAWSTASCPPRRSAG